MDGGRKYRTEASGSTCRTVISDDADVQFILREDKAVPQEHQTFEEPIHKEPTSGSALPQDVRETPADTENVNTENVNTENVNTEKVNDMTEWTIPRSESYSFGDAMTTMASNSSNTLIFKGQFFPRKKDLKRLAGLHALRQNFEWKVKMSNKSAIHLVYKIENCSWKLRAERVKERTYFHVRSFVNEHSYLLEVVHHRHRQASAAVIEGVVAHRLQNEDGRTMRLRDIIGDMKQMYDIQMLYSKAHKSLKYALSKINK
ncbi:hypothetical protein Dsin_002770 [Dipteronia sinensis]|uniref:Transposase MuDR plant domain-containing protein n=1 Tax=Dipteronia sinensis TaxID=43782 RepID=A0AAE0EK02_9ROSI|nr:hypothetical protein Dsin_002770 [Dipteronia sinensis]